MLFRVVGFRIDDFRRCLTSYGVVETVLEHCIEISCGLCVAVIVNAALSIDVRNLLPDTALTGPNGITSAPAVLNGNDGIQVVKINKLIDFSSFASVYDCFHFGNSHF